MSFSRYPKYKDSGVEWLGTVPEHWEVKPLRGLAREERSAFIDGDWIEAPFITDDGVRLIQTGNISVGRYKEQGFRYVSQETFENLGCTEVDVGDILICRLADPVGRACLAPNLGSPMITSVDVCILKPRTDVEAKFVVYMLSSAHYLGFMDGQCRGGTRDRVSRSFLGGVRVTLPPSVEQRQVVAFLDRETAKIDELVAEQQKLVELLKEKRQAVISHAVTKGLNPRAPMKPSGIEWLGDVPAHWDLQRLKHAVRSIEQGWSPQCEGSPAEGAEWGILKVGCVNGGTFNGSENKVLPSDLKPEPTLAIARDDLLISRANTRELVGSAAVADCDYPTLMICDKLYRIRFQPRTCSPRFVSLYLGSSAVRNQIELGATGASSSMLNIGQSTILDLVIAAPPFEEQLKVVELIATETAKLDVLMVEAQNAIDLLQERRTALISAAVTGQIDVRELAAS